VSYHRRALEEFSMATILQFERSQDDREARIKYEALALACTQLGTASRSHTVRKVIAHRIIKAMEKGERDPARLCTIGIAALGPVIVHSATRPAERPRFPAAPLKFNAERKRPPAGLPPGAQPDVEGGEPARN
jgi:hypothetical protein